MSHFYVIGMNDSPNPDFSPEILQIIQSHRVFQEVSGITKLSVLYYLNKRSGLI